MSLGLKNRETIVTGGSKGIGKVVADWLGRAGAKLNIIARKDKELSETEREFKKKGFKVKTFKADVLEIEQIKSIIASLGRVDILVNCAGVQGEIGPFHEDDYNKWKHQSFGRILLNGNEEKKLEFEHYLLKVNCSIMDKIP